MSRTNDPNPFAEHAARVVADYPLLSPLQSASLPKSHLRSAYAMDLALTMSQFIWFEDFGVRGLSRFRQRHDWETSSRFLGFGVSIAYMHVLTENPSILSPGSRSYLTGTMESLVTGSGRFIETPGEFESTTIKVFKTIVASLGLRETNDSETTQRYMSRRLKVLSGVVGAVAAIDRLRDYYPSLPDDLLAPVQSRGR